MFAIIDTKGATHIAIHIPHQGSEKTLPALAAMLEQNSVFIKQGYQEMGTIKPVMGISLGDVYRLEQYGVEIELVVPESSSVISEGFQHATPAIYTSNQKAIQTKEKEIEKLRTENNYLKEKIKDIEAKAAEVDE
jgi:hypothetical protein